MLPLNLYLLSYLKQAAFQMIFIIQFLIYTLIHKFELPFQTRMFHLFALVTFYLQFESL